MMTCQTPGKFILVILLVGICLFNGACSFLPFGTYANEGPIQMPPASTRASLVIPDLPNDVFIGVAMSGGGSRAANFSVAALLELQDLRILDKVSTISSISGSSLVAGYYGLYGHDSEVWNLANLQETFRQDFQSSWIARWFLPWHIARYWTSDFDRSDIMKEVFDSFLFLFPTT